LPSIHDLASGHDGYGNAGPLGILVEALDPGDDLKDRENFASFFERRRLYGWNKFSLIGDR
jgi:hypothetical protein